MFHLTNHNYYNGLSNLRLFKYLQRKAYCVKAGHSISVTVIYGLLLHVLSAPSRLTVIDIQSSLMFENHTQSQ